MNGVTTYYVGNHYEVKNSVVTKYYFAGATRLAVRTNGTLSYLLGDHIGSSSVTTDANGVKTASALYKAFGETRFSAGNLGTDYKFTGQREEASLGIYYFNARWFDPSLGRFTSPDSIVPTSTQGTQAWDRYAFVNNNPVRYNDPTGHTMTGEGPAFHQFSNQPCIDTANYKCPEPPANPSTSNNQGGNNQGSNGDKDKGKKFDLYNAVLSYCGGEPGNVWYNMANCASTETQDLALLVDLPFALLELVLIATACDAGPEACIAGVGVADVIFFVTGGDILESGLSWASTGFSFLAYLAAGRPPIDSPITDNLATSFATSLVGMPVSDPIVDTFIDGYGSGVNHGIFHGVISKFNTLFGN